MNETISTNDKLTAQGRCPTSAPLGKAEGRGQWRAEIRNPAGELVHVEEWGNLITNAGLNQLLQGGLVDGGPWYVGLTDGAPTPAAGDTMAAHPGWAEVDSYDEAARQVWTPGAVASQAVDNTASPAIFTVTSNGTTIGGAFLVSNTTKSGTAGTLFAIGAFTQGDVTLSAGSTITVSASFTQAAV